MVQPTGQETILDGFTVTAGNADGSGPEGTITKQGAAVHIRDGANDEVEVELKSVHSWEK